MSAGPPVKGVDPRAEPEDDGVGRLAAGPAMTEPEALRDGVRPQPLFHLSPVMPGLAPGIHAFAPHRRGEAWMAGTGPAITACGGLWDGVRPQLPLPCGRGMGLGNAAAVMSAGAKCDPLRSGEIMNTV